MSTTLPAARGVTSPVSAFPFTLPSGNATDNISAAGHDTVLQLAIRILLMCLGVILLGSLTDQGHRQHQHNKLRAPLVSIIRPKSVIALAR